MNFFDRINSHKYIYLGGIEEGLDNSLRIIVKEAGINVEPESVAIGDVMLTAQAIESNKDSQNYEVVFASYISYSVIDESYAMPNDDELFEGRIFCIYEKSAFLDYVSKASCASEGYPGPFKHYGFNCLNHVIDIASTEEPIIKLE